MKKCTECGIEKDVNFFYKNKRGVKGGDSKCKTCRKKYASEYRLKNPEKIKKDNIKFRERYKKETGGYAVYYLPEEHYVGFTNCVKTRILDHSKTGKIVEGYETIAVYKCAIDAHLTETILHKMGYNGFQYKY